MYPHERSLVKKYAGAPFALVGVNSDKTVERARKAIADNDLNWRSFYQGSSRDNPDAISIKWNIRGWPTIFLIDHKGVIRYRGHSMDDELLDRLIADAKRDAKK